MTELVLMAATDKRPDGPSWSPYLAIGLFIACGIIAVSLYLRNKRK